MSASAHSYLKRCYLACLPVWLYVLLTPSLTAASDLFFDSFPLTVKLPLQIESNRFVVVDINGDELPDVIVADNSRSVLHVLKRNPKRPTGWQLFEFPQSDPVLGLLSADINGNRKPDLIVAKADGIWLYEDHGVALKNTLARQLISHTYALTANIDMEITDINTDGELDLVTFETGNPDSLQIHFNNDGNFTALTPVSSAIAPDNCCIARPQFIDTNIDARPDYVGFFDNVLQIRLNSENGSFGELLQIPLAENPITDLNIYDIDADKKPDIILTTLAENQSQILAFRQRKNSGFETKRLQLAEWNEGNFEIEGLIDIDNDGIAELFLRPLIVKGGHVPTYIYRRDRSSMDLVYRRQSGIGKQRIVAAADFNRDGVLEFLALDSGGQLNHLVNTGRVRNWLSIQLRGQDDQPIVGSTIALKMKDGRGLSHQLRVINDSGIIVERHELLFGLGRNTSVTQLEVFWTGQRYTRIDEPLVNRRIGFVQPEAAIKRKVSIQYPVLDFSEEAVLKVRRK